MARPITAAWLPDDPKGVAEQSRRMYLRAMAGWTSDLLRGAAGLRWPERDPVADYQDHDWRRLYRGSILDD